MTGRTMARRLAFTGLLGAFALPGATASAQPATTIVVPFAPGGPSDLVGRAVAEALRRVTGQNFVVENVSGAGGTIGAARVAQGRPDGSVLLLGNIGVATAPALYRRLPFDTVRDLEPIGLIAPVPMLLLARPDLPATDLNGLLEWLRRPGADATIAHSGVGSSSHLCALLLRGLTRATALRPIAYRGTAPAMGDVMSGRVDLICDQTSAGAPYVLDNRVRGLVVTDGQRSATVPAVPTAAEAGLPDLVLSVWHGLYAPRGTPAAITTRLAEALRAGLAEPDVAARFASLGGAVEPPERITPAAHRALLASEIARWRPIIEANGEFAD